MRTSDLRVRLWAFVVFVDLAAAGCGSVNNKHLPDAAADANPPADAPGPDAPGPDAPGPDAAVVPRCDPAKPFGVPTAVVELNSSARDQGAKLTDDELTVYFGSDRLNATGLYKATRSSPTSPFGTPIALSMITGAASGPTLTGDGLTLYYTLGNAGAGDIYATRRASKAVEFAAGVLVPGTVNSSVDDLDPFITEDESTLYFDSARDTGALHLFVAVRQASGSFGAPQALTSLNAGPIDGHPVLSHDGLTLYWSSTRTDGGAKGSTDIWFARRPMPAAAFGAPARIAELSSASAESLSWISADGCVAYLQSDRPGGMGAQDIYQAVKPM